MFIKRSKAEKNRPNPKRVKKEDFCSFSGTCSTGAGSWQTSRTGAVHILLPEKEVYEVQEDDGPSMVRV